MQGEVILFPAAMVRRGDIAVGAEHGRTKRRPKITDPILLRLVAARDQRTEGDKPSRT
jgi:hypothetical protein